EAGALEVLHGAPVLRELLTDWEPEDGEPAVLLPELLEAVGDGVAGLGEVAALGAALSGRNGREVTVGGEVRAEARQGDAGIFGGVRVVLHLDPLEVLNDALLARCRVGLGELFGEWVAEERRAAVRLPVALEPRRHKVPRLLHVDVLGRGDGGRIAGIGGEPLDERQGLHPAAAHVATTEPGDRARRNG